MKWKKAELNHERGAALKIAIHTLEHMDKLVFSEVIFQLKGMLEEAGNAT